MKRLTQKDDNGYYLTGDGIYSDWGVPEKFRGEDIDRLAAIEDILGDEYNLDRLRELVEAEKEDRYIIMKEPRRAGVHRLTELAEADREGRCVVFRPGYPVVSAYYRDEDGIFVRDVTGAVTEKEYIRRRPENGGA